MPNLPVRWKLFFGSLFLVALSLLPAQGLLARKLRAEVTRRLDTELWIRIELVAAQASKAGFDPADRPRWDGLADDLARRARGRVTLIARSGEVLGDSELDAARLGEVENHSGRPEVAAALTSGRGTSRRLSVTLQRRMLFVAVPFASDAGVAGVARLAVPLADVEEALAGLDRAIFLATLIAIGLAAMTSAAAAGPLSRSLRALAALARRMAGGDLTLRAGSSGSDEVAALGRAFDQLAGNLSATLGALRTERDLLGGVLEAMREGVLLLDRDGRVAVVNAALREMLLLRSDAVGKTPLDLVRNADLDAALAGALTGETASTEIEVGDLKPRRLLVNVTRLSTERGGLLAVFVDMTDIRRLETMRRDFVANVSHELRTPVAAATAATETLRMAAEKDPSRVAEFVGMIERNLQRLWRLLEDLLELSRIEARELRLHPEPLEIGVLVAQILTMFDHRAAPKSIRLVSEIPPDLAPVNADRRAFEQILTNLIDNAVKYCPEEATITVRAASAGDSVNVAVEDTGPGIEARHLPRLFERFYRVDSGRSRDVGGTGLGLSIVKQLVEAIGGKITVDSSVGKGTTFAFKIPRA